MKYLKYVFGSLLIAGVLGLAGCGSGGDKSRSDGDRNVLKEISVDREIKVEGVVRSYKTGAPLRNVQVTLYQGGKKTAVTTVATDGHYAFSKVKVSDDKSVAAANNAANQVQLEFSEVKTKNSTGGSGSSHYENGTTEPSYPDSRIEITYVSPEFTAIPTLTSADHSADALAGAALGGGLTNLALVDAINEGRSYYFTDANTVKVFDVRLVQVGSLTGAVADSDTGLPIAGATVTLDQDAMFTAAPAVAGDTIAVWQQTRISTLTDVNGEFTLSKIPALDYTTDGSTAIFHVEARGYTQNPSPAAGLGNDHSNIQDDLNGSVGLWLLAPIKVTMKTVTAKFVNENRQPLEGVKVQFKYDASDDGAGHNSAYATAVKNGIATETLWTATSDVDGIVTLSVPAMHYNVHAADKQFTAKLDGYILDTTFSTVVSDKTNLQLDLIADGGVKKLVDLGVIKMIIDTQRYAAEYKTQIIYKGAPVVGARLTGIVKYVDPDVATVPITTVTKLVEGDGASDVNGFVTFNTNKIPATKAGLSVNFELDVNLTGATSIATGGALTGKYVVKTQPDLTDIFADAAVTTVDENDVHQIEIVDKALKLEALEGYLVTGHKNAPTDSGTVSFKEAADITVSLKVTKNVTPVPPATTSSITYYTKTNSDGLYNFSTTDGVNVPTTSSNNDIKLELGLVGGYVFSDGLLASIDLSAAVGADNGVDQLDSAPFWGNTRWLQQLSDTAGVAPFFLADKYDGKTLQVHTAAIEPEAATETNLHVVTLLKTVAGVNTTAIIQNDGAQLVYTFTKDQDDGTGIQVVMSKTVDNTKPFKYDGLTGANLPADTKEFNRLRIVTFEPGTPNNTTPDGEILTYTATASGRTITIVPSGNANKFQQGVTYELQVRVVATDGSVSDDTLRFRFFDKASEIFSTEKPSFDVSTMTAGDYWFLYNNVDDDADNVKFALNRAPGGALVQADVHALVYKDSTSFGYATGAIQNRAVNLNSLKLRFPFPTDLRTGTTADITNAAVLGELTAAGDFAVYAQAYTTSGIILQHWTKVGNTAAAGNEFLAYEAGYLKMNLNLSGNADIWAKAIAEGNKIDLTVVHKNSQINPATAKVLTISVADLAGVQAKSLNNNVGGLADGNPFTAEVWRVTLDSEVDADATAVPTATTSVHGVTLSDVQYSAANQIDAKATLTFDKGTDVTVSATTSLNVATSNIMVTSGTSTLVLNINTADATLQALNTEMRVGRRLVWDADGAATATAAVNNAITRSSSFIQTSIPVIKGADKDYTYDNTGAIVDNTLADNSILSAVDIDINVGALSGVAVGNVATPGRTYDIKFANCNDRIKAVLNHLKADDVISISGHNFYLKVTAAAAGNVLPVVEDGNFAADVRVGLAYDGTSSVGGSLVLAPQVKAGGAWTSDDTQTGLAFVTSRGSDTITGFRGAFNSNYNTPIDSTTVVVNVATQLYIGDTVYLLAKSATAAAGNHPVYSAVVAGAIDGAASTLVALKTITQVRGDTEAFAAQGQTGQTNGFVFGGDTITITSLGTGVTSLHNGAALNTNGDTVSNAAYTDGADVQHGGGKGFDAVK